MEELSREELLEKIEELQQEIDNLKKRKKKKKRQNIKTSPKEIVDYWKERQDECGLSVDWAEAEERCWRCGYKKNLQRCHIIPDSLGGKDEPENLVLLCERCDIDAPNVESKTFMWDWIRANGTSLYDTFWNIRAQNEYEFIYKKSFIEELKERDILNPRDLEAFRNLKIGRSVKHFAHPWKNDSTNAGLLKMLLEAYDEKYKNKKNKSRKIREKEKKFDEVVFIICNIAKQYNWNVWEGRSKNPFSITISTIIDVKKQKGISIKLCRDEKYRACFTNEYNPNNNKANNYTIEIGKEKEEIEQFVRKEVEEFYMKNGKSKRQEYVETIAPIYHLKKEED